MTQIAQITPMRLGGRSAPIRASRCRGVIWRSIGGLPVVMVALGAGPARAQWSLDSAKARLATIEGRLPVAGLDSAVEVRRDRWGVPHIYAKTVHDLFFAQ